MTLLIEPAIPLNADQVKRLLIIRFAIDTVAQQQVVGSLDHLLEMIGNVMAFQMHLRKRIAQSIHALSCRMRRPQ